MKIKNIKQKIKNYNFLCIGACHKDMIISLKNDIKFFRTNPVDSKFELGGVASNISHNLSLFSNNDLSLILSGASIFESSNADCQRLVAEPD